MTLHTAAINVGTQHVVCVCGEYFQTHAYDGTAVAQFARHLKKVNDMTPSVPPGYA